MIDSRNFAFYLYGFGRSAHLLPRRFPTEVSANVPSASEESGASPKGTDLAGGMAGVDERYAPFVWHHANYAAILSLVPKEDFGGPAGDSHLKDLSWLTPRICRHERLLELAMSLSPVLPARFGTLFSSLTTLNTFMEQHEAAVAQYFERTEGYEEWGVKGRLDRARAEKSLVLRLQAEQNLAAPQSAGLVYLNEQKWQLQAREELEVKLTAFCGDLFDELACLAKEARERQVISSTEANSNQELVINWAFLVAKTAAADFQKQVAEATCRALEGFDLALSGPWPAYSFCPALEPTPEETSPSSAKIGPNGLFP